MKIYAIYCVFTVDSLKKENLIISTNDEEIRFPIFQIEHNRHLHNEAHYYLQGLFKKTSYNPEILKNINFTHMDVQNALIYKYLEEKEADNQDYNLEKDVFVLCCSTIESPYALSTYKWKKFDFVKSFSGMDIINSIVDYSIEKSIL